MIPIRNLSRREIRRYRLLQAENGVDTPGCDCGHDGMGAAWHASCCRWLTTQPDPHARPRWRTRLADRLAEWLLPSDREDRA